MFQASMHLHRTNTITISTFMQPSQWLDRADDCACRPSVRPDMRAFWLSCLASAPPRTTIALLWPRLIPLHHTIARALSTLPMSPHGESAGILPGLSASREYALMNSIMYAIVLPVESLQS